MCTRQLIVKSKISGSLMKIEAGMLDNVDLI